MLSEVCVCLKDFCVALRDVFLGRSFYSLETSIVIRVPKHQVWDALWSSGRFQGDVPLDYTIQRLPGDTECYKHAYALGDAEYSNILQLQDIRAGEGFVAQRFYDDTEHESYAFDMHYCGLGLVETNDGQATVLTQCDHIQTNHLLDRLIYAVELRFLLHCFKTHCEASEKLLDAQDGSSISETSECDQDAVVVPTEQERWQAGLYMACAFLAGSVILGPSWGIFVLLMLSAQELGVVIALHRLGFKGHDFLILPFVGSSVVQRLRFRSHFNGAFCVLMAGGCGLMATAALYVSYMLLGYSFLGQAVALAALLNLVYLFPLWPFAGSRIISHIFASIHDEDILAAGWTTLLVGIGASLYHGYIFIALLAGFVAYCLVLSDQLHEDDALEAANKTFDDGCDDAKTMSYSSLVFVLLCYTALLAFCGIMFYTVLGHRLLEPMDGMLFF
ncbi:MAG: hypothetical protein AAF228_02200 [Pseudomonadota bacterium]